MSRVAIITDSSCCLPPDYIQKFGITVVPHALIIDGQVHEDSTLTPRRLFGLMASARGFPTTAPPAPGAFLEAFRGAASQADAALCITLASRRSAGTFSSAVSAADLAREEQPHFPIRVLDCRNLAMAQGFVVLAAARAAAQGADLDAVVAAAEDVIGRAHLLGILDTLHYAVKGGRVPFIAHWATSLLQIKPILTARQEELKRLDLRRTYRRATERLLHHTRQRIEPGRPLHIAVMHTDALAEAEDLAQRIRRDLQPAELIITEFTPVMAVHAGPRFLGVAFYSEAPIPQTAASGSGSQEAQPQSSAPTLEDDVHRIEAALHPLPPPQPRPALVVVSGLPGSGKSHFTRQLCQRFPLARLESDALRKALFSSPSHTAEESARLFAACHRVLDRLLASGIPAVLDATNLREIHRRQLYRIAEKHGAQLVLVSLKAPPAVVRQRLTARQRGANPWDHSEADVAVYEHMRRQAEPIRRSHISVDTSGDIEHGIEAVLRHLIPATEGQRM